MSDNDLIREARLTSLPTPLSLTRKLADRLKAANERVAQLEKAWTILYDTLGCVASSSGVPAYVIRNIDTAFAEVDALAGVPTATEEKPDEWCPGHGSFSEHRRTLKSDCTLCRGEYTPKQTVSAGAGQVPADTIEKTREVIRDAIDGMYGHVSEHGIEEFRAALTALAAVLPVDADTIEKAQAVVEAYTAWTEDHNDGQFAYYKKEDLMNACVELRAALAAVRTPEGQT